MTLGAIYGADTPGRDIIRKFDYLAGNSGGSIVLTALCCNYTPGEIAALYHDPAVLRRLYCPRWVASIPLLRNVLPRYSSRGKFAALKRMFDRKAQPGEPDPSAIPIQDWPKVLDCDLNLMVTAFDYDRERAVFFRSNRASRAKSSAPAIEATLVEAVHASTNAPIIYFDRPAEFSGHRFWDGALAGYNNPVLAAVLEALANQPEQVGAMVVLSIGTGTSAQPLITEGAAPPLGKALDSTCQLSALKKVATVIVDDPPDAATFHAHVALRQPMPSANQPCAQGNLVRLCPLVRPLWNASTGAWSLPDGLSAAEFQALVEMPSDAMTRGDVELNRKMCDLWLANKIPNQPIQMGAHLQCDIGHASFAAAVAHWQQISTAEEESAVAR
jgi:hypothetical protein